MSTIKYNIISGESPFTSELTPSLIPVNTHLNVGNYEFLDVPNGSYTLIIKDSNNCIFEKELTVDPFVTTTTTTTLQSDSIIVGQVQDEILIFNTNATNISTKYEGYPDENIIILYLWLRTYDGSPIITSKIIDYTINGTSGNSFSFVSLSDQTHAEVIQSIGGPSESISGQLVLKSGFIETFFQYIYIKDYSIPDLNINLSSNENWLYQNIPIVNNINQYGVTYINGDNVIMKF